MSPLLAALQLQLGRNADLVAALSHAAVQTWAASDACVRNVISMPRATRDRAQVMTRPSSDRRAARTAVVPSHAPSSCSNRCHREQRGIDCSLGMQMQEFEFESPRHIVSVGRHNHGDLAEPGVAGGGGGGLRRQCCCCTPSRYENLLCVGFRAIFSSAGRGRALGIRSLNSIEGS